MPTAYSADSFAKMHGVTVATVRRWCREGRVVCHRIGKKWEIYDTFNC